MSALRRRLPKLSYANVMSTIAVFGVLGGSAWAASKIGTSDIQRRAVTAPKLDRQAVKAPKIAKRAVKSGKIRPEAVRKGKIRDNAVTGDKVREATLATVPDAEKLGGFGAEAFGAGILGASVETGAVPFPPGAATFGGPPIGSGDAFQMPAPVAMQVRDLVATRETAVPQPAALVIRRNDENALTCAFPAGSSSCQPAPGPAKFEQGDLLGLQIQVSPVGVPVAANTYRVGYRVTP